jgi:hypothetical protein
MVVLRWHCDNRLLQLRERLADGPMFRRAAFSAATVQRMCATFEGRMLPEYLRDADAQCRPYPIVPIAAEGRMLEPRVGQFT